MMAGYQSGFPVLSRDETKKGFAHDNTGSLYAFTNRLPAKRVCR